MMRPSSLFGSLQMLLWIFFCRASRKIYSRNRALNGRSWINSQSAAFTACRIHSPKPQNRCPTTFHRYRIFKKPRRVNLACQSARRHCASRLVTSTDLNDMSGCSVSEVLDYSVPWLESRDVSEPLSSITQLLSVALQLPWSNGFVSLRNLHGSTNENDPLGQRVLTQDEWQLFHSMAIRRAQHEPIQYILGKWDFLDYTLEIQAPLLCPRPETEELVGHVIKDAKQYTTPRILDVGSGTGAIGIALAKALPTGTRVVAIDVERIAIEVSKRNAIQLLSAKNSYQVVLSSAHDFETRDSFDIVVSNPPYIPKSDMATLSADVARYESHSALCGGEDGLDVIREIVFSLQRWCPDGGVCWMEVDPSHPPLLEQWLQEEGGDVTFVDCAKDMFGRDRFVKLEVVAAHKKPQHDISKFQCKVPH